MLSELKNVSVAELARSVSHCSADASLSHPRVPGRRIRPFGYEPKRYLPMCMMTRVVDLRVLCDLLQICHDRW